MNRTLQFFILLLLFSSCSDPRDKTIEHSVTDDLGNVFLFSEIPVRVISLAPSITECIFYINVENNLKGITDYCDYPQGVEKKVRVGGMIDPNTELIARLNPDLIFITTEGNSQLTYKNLKELGYRVFVFNPKTVNDIYRMLERLNEIFRPEKGSETLRRFSDSLAFKKSRDRTFAGFISVKPLITFNSNTFINDIFSGCGFINVYGSEKLDYPSVSDEDLNIKNPDYLMIMINSSPGLKEKLNEEIIKRFGSLKSVRDNKIIYLDESIFSRPGPRVIRAMQFLNEQGD
jgi:iron complex transport system substrate-binding protein